MMTYEQVLAHLDALQMHKIKLGLEAMQDFLERVDRPETKIRFVHLAGTNGKGSVCAVLSEILSRAGYKVGVYTSPHLSSVRERFRVGSEYISEDDFARLGTRICEVLGEDQITYFEFTTALGFLWFAELEVDLVLLETGMGGRLDATNVVTPLVSVITSVSMDHEAYLGDSLEAIAGEKAGIIKEGVPVVSSAIHPEVAPVVEKVCREKKSPLYSFRRDFDYTMGEDSRWDWQGGERLDDAVLEGLQSNSASLVRQENESLALATLLLLAKENIKVEKEDIRKGLLGVTWPGRMEYFELQPPAGNTASGGGIQAGKLRYLLDGAHNPAGVKNLVDSLEQCFSHNKAIGIWGAMFDKDLTGILETITPLFDQLIITQPDGDRSASPEQIFALLDSREKEKTICVTGVPEALQAAQERAGEDDLIVIGGSLYLVGSVRFLLKGDLV